MPDLAFRLRNWGAWLRATGRRRHHALSQEGKFRSRQFDTTEQVMLIAINADDAELIEAACCTLPPWGWDRFALRYKYPFNDRDQVVCRVASRESGEQVRWVDYPARIALTHSRMEFSLTRSKEENVARALAFATARRGDAPQDIRHYLRMRVGSTPSVDHRVPRV
jgi:hypothetical protein